MASSSGGYEAEAEAESFPVIADELQQTHAEDQGGSPMEKLRAFSSKQQVSEFLKRMQDGRAKPLLFKDYAYKKTVEREVWFEDPHECVSVLIPLSQTARYSATLRKYTELNRHRSLVF